MKYEPRQKQSMNKKISNLGSDTGGVKDVKKLQRAAMALEEILWALKKSKLEHLQDVVDILHAIANDSSPNLALSRGFQSADPNKHFLIGVLPRLLQDKALFPVNGDIVDFANGALGLEMNRSLFEKRSRYEIIGKVICETDTLSEQKLTDLVAALEKITGNKDRLAQVIERKRSDSFSWNETIQDLLR